MCRKNVNFILNPLSVGNILIYVVIVSYINCALSFFLSQVMVSVTVVSASVHQTGRVRTVTAPDVLTPVCPTWAYCATGGANVCAEPVSAHNLVHMGPLVTSVPPVLTPVQ